MDHLHFGNTKENYQVTEGADDCLNISVNESLQFFKPNKLNMVVQMQQNYSKNDYVLKNKICMIFTKTLFFSVKILFFLNKVICLK